ncbi:MAG: hypothetical protein H6733_12000 [Alphaproteobacteria bacterium]|nr:hypothetical protein [Alphaproteobacteria bacterium]
MTWSIETSRSRMTKAAEALSSFHVVPLPGKLDLQSIPLDKGYLLEAVHLYVDITNATKLLSSDAEEGERAHRRFLRFLHLYQRSVARVFDKVDVVKVDFQNQRLHVVVLEPMDDPKARVLRALAIAAALDELVRRMNDDHAELADASLRAGLEIGESVAVRNGTRGDREPLFLGRPANRAAHLLKGGSKGVVMGERAWKLLTDQEVSEPEMQPIAAADLHSVLKDVCPTIDIDALVAAWRAEVHTTPQSTFKFHAPTLPLSKLDFATLTPSHSARVQSCVSVLVDLDGFSEFVQACRDTAQDEVAARILHVLRKEMRDLATSPPFNAKKVRYVGDSMEAVLSDVTPQKAATNALQLAGALRDMMAEAKTILPEAEPLGLQIGVALGPIALTRLGRKGNLDPCQMGLAVERARSEQEGCSGRSTRVDQAVWDVLPSELRRLVPGREGKDLGYNEVHAALVEAGLLTVGSLASSPATTVLPRAFGR